MSHARTVTRVKVNLGDFWADADQVQMFLSGEIRHYAGYRSPTDEAPIRQLTTCLSPGEPQEFEVKTKVRTSGYAHAGGGSTRSSGAANGSIGMDSSIW